MTTLQSLIEWFLREIKVFSIYTYICCLFISECRQTNSIATAKSDIRYYCHRLHSWKLIKVHVFLPCRGFFLCVIEICGVTETNFQLFNCTIGFRWICYARHLETSLFISIHVWIGVTLFVTQECADSGRTKRPVHLLDRADVVFVETLTCILWSFAQITHFR